MIINMRAEFDPTPIRHLAVQCPHCQNWFHGHDITDDDIQYEYQLDYATFHCPICNKDFGHNAEPRSIWNRGSNANKINIQEESYPNVYKDCLEKKESVRWE